MNVIAAILKVIKRILLHQMLDYLDNNDVIHKSHHGAVKGRLTQTLVTEIHDWLLENKTREQEAALLILDQSKAYKIIDHEILLQKMDILGFKNQAVKIMKSFLQDRKQLVQVEGHRSEVIVTGPHSVIQGSSLSCLLYLIFILDFPDIFHNQNHEPITMRYCKKTNLKTYIDDAFILIQKEKDKEIGQSITETMETVSRYTDANKLCLNQDKTNIMIQTKDKKKESEFKISLGGKVLKSKTEVKILGNTLSSNLTWDRQVSNILIPALKNRIRSLNP